MGNEIPKEMNFWTKEEYLKFSEVMLDKPRSYYAFEMLYWCGIRSGELLALTPADFNFENQTVTISKTHDIRHRAVSMTELYDTVYPPRTPIVDGFLYGGTYLFVGAPKVGKSFFMGQLVYHVAMGLPL